MTDQPQDEEQMLFPDLHPERPQAPTLDALITAARVEAATVATGGQVGEVVRRLADADGALPVATLRTEGYPDDAITAAITPDSKDKRRKPRARLGIVAGQPMVWLTTTGWAASGRTSRRERHPDAESTAHAAAPSEVGGWLAARLAGHHFARVGVATGEPVKAWAEQVKALAWSRIQGAGDTTGTYGTLTGGIYPDALLVERWRDPSLYASAWGREPDAPEDAAEQLLGLEIELSAKRDEPLAWKVRRWASCLDLGAAAGVVWVVASQEVAENLAALGVGGQQHPRQFLVAAHALGLAGEPLPDLPLTWWPLRLQGEEEAR